jgi:23S rRNA pseudouridine2604 synthase
MAWSRKYTQAEPQRINRWLAQSGVCSRREAEGLIARGLVLIDGAPVSDLGRKIEPGQTLVLLDQAQDDLQSKITLVFHKPVGIVSAQPEPGQIPAIRLMTPDALWGESDVQPNAETRLAPLGRLDRDSRGLLLLSQDGVLAKAVIGPDSDLSKEYLVTVEGLITDKKLSLLRYGLELDGRRLKPAEVMHIDGQHLRFVLHEGRNRQIRRMCEAVGLTVSDLFRIRIGSLVLGDLPEGRWRPLSLVERAALLQAAVLR